MEENANLDIDSLQGLDTIDKGHSRSGLITEESVAAASLCHRSHSGTIFPKLTNSFLALIIRAFSRPGIG